MKEAHLTSVLKNVASCVANFLNTAKQVSYVHSLTIKYRSLEEAQVHIFCAGKILFLYFNFEEMISVTKHSMKKD